MASWARKSPLRLNPVGSKWSRSLGFRDVALKSFPLVLTDPADAFGLPTWPETWRAEGAFTDEEIREWRLAMEQRPLPGFRYRVTFLVVAGTKG
jgi:hypothetical protein